MRLVPVSNDDVVLYKAMFCNPVHMADLGGCHSEEKAVAILEKQSNFMASDKGWVFKIVPDEDDWKGNVPTEPDPNGSQEYFEHELRWENGVGTVCLWTGEYKDNDVTEIGWGIAPKYQGHGFGTQAVKMLLDKAKSSGRWGCIHAFTSVNNGSSNALAKKAGFTWIEECDIDYDEKPMRAHHYTYDT